MREILFRGLEKQMFCKPRWRFGNLVVYPDGIVYIRTQFSKFFVDPETVGQYTGLKDKNGIRIFEGDIVSKYHAVTFKNSSFCINDDRLLTSDCEVIGNIHENPNLMNDNLTQYQLLNARTNSILQTIWTDNFVKAFETYIAEASVRTGVVLQQLSEQGEIVWRNDSYINGIEINKEW